VDEVHRSLVDAGGMVVVVVQLAYCWYATYRVRAGL
jgi:hypothetical protein